MEPFLKQVARVYLEREGEAMMDYCFVFPNKRSGVFFRHWLIELSRGKPLFLPAISTVSEITSQLSTLVEADRLDQLFTLFNEYSTLSGDIADFDRFLFWGEMILSDFNDVDRDLVDARKLFVNLKRYREVSTDYLTPVQKEVLSRYWGAEFEETSPDEFWKHLHYDKPTDLEQKFLKLWEVLWPLYDRFTRTLRSRGTGTQGMMARDAVERMRTLPTSSLPYRRYIFIGFNVLSLCELRLLENLQTRGVADFYWDMASPAFADHDNRAARFMRRNAETFPSLYRLPDEHLDFPEITVTGVPSGVGQAKTAGRILRRWVDDGTIADPTNAINTAVVLPDEGLLIPMIHAVPPTIDPLNVTMGLPLRSTSFSSFIAAVVSLHLRAHFDGDGWQFFFEDIKTIISHPLTRRIDRAGCNALLQLINDRRLYMVPSADAAEVAPRLAFIFTPIADNNDPASVYAYFHTLLTALLEAVAPEEETTEQDEENPGDDAPQRTVTDIEAYYISCYLEALDNLMAAISRHCITMRDITFIQLLRKAIGSATASLDGEPLAGLQMMGVLETRALDFDNIILLSMNERIFPRKHFKRSFIPDNLRKAYGMATADFQESIYAYYFYRLISRASRVEMLYDARSSGGKSSEISRYVAQLLYLFPDAKVTHRLDSFDMSLPEEVEISVEKTPDLLRRLDEFRTPGGRCLSASSINDYINCPLSFYLKRLCRLDLDEEVIDYMDSATYGSILHRVAERIYKDLRGDAQYVKVTPEMIDAILADTVTLDRLITSVVNEIYNHRSPGDLSELVGEARVLAKVMRHFIELMLKEERKNAPFDFIDGEHPVTGTFEVRPGMNINIMQYIDRIDRTYPPGHYGDPTQGWIRIVDYKTGGDKVSFTGMDQLFDNTLSDRRKAVMQVLFYCNAYARKIKYEGPVQPMIYRFATISTRGLTPLSFKSEPLIDYQKCNKEFMEHFARVIDEIFDPATPFVQAPDDHNCRFCSFKDLCRRNPR
ncbi:MAG: PD-(D/E)XK nuclease family protein [Muribaculaceae bacterium]|nr:PD-(D/E)XK nuclease family protein [Muribaculaceae bacterium]